MAPMLRMHAPIHQARAAVSASLSAQPRTTVAALFPAF
jgi:hypothetical protein